MEEKQIGFFTKVKISLTSPKAYADLLKESMGKAIVYLLLICIIFGGIAAIKDIVTYEQVINNFSVNLKDKVPDFTFKDGELNVAGTMPIILDDDKGNPIIINTDATTDKSLLDNYSSGILITKTELFQKISPTSTKETSFESLKTMTFTNANLSNWLNISKVLVFFTIIIEPLFFFGFKFISVLIITILGLILNAIFKSKLFFKELYKLSIYAITLSIIVKVGFKLFDVPTGVFSLFSLLYYGIGLVYLGLALKAINKNQQEIKDSI